MFLPLLKKKEGWRLERRDSGALKECEKRWVFFKDDAECSPDDPVNRSSASQAV